MNVKVFQVEKSELRNVKDLTRHHVVMGMDDLMKRTLSPLEKDHIVGQRGPRRLPVDNTPAFTPSL